MNELTISTHELASVNAQVETAKRFPRDAKKALQASLELATLNEDIAASMFYKKPVGKDDNGKQTYAEGASVRLAEVVAGNWGNLRVATRIVDVGDKSVTVEAMAHDLESNFATVATVSRSIVTKRGYRYSDSQVAVTLDAAMSIARRNAIFQVVPRVLAETIFQQCKKVAVGDVKRLADRRAGAFNYFKKLGVSEEQILQKLGRENLSQVDADDVATLIGLWQSIKDKEISIDAAFGDDEKPKTAAQVAAEKFEAEQ